MITDFLYNNIRWNLNRHAMDGLLTLPTTETQYKAQLEKLANKYFPEKRQINVLPTEFMLNRIALTRGTNEVQETVKAYFSQYWSDFQRLKATFDKKYLTFPASANKTRIESVAELITKCTQFAVDDSTIAKLQELATEILQLSEREQRYLVYAVELYKIDFFCVAALAAFDGKQIGVRALAKTLRPRLLNQEYSKNDRYCQASYQTNRLTSLMDCLGNSLAKFDDTATHIAVKTFVYANGRNVFDTFLESRFGNNVAEFRSKDKTFQAHMRYFLQGSTEIRNLTFTNTGKNKRKFSLEIPVKYADAMNKATYFYMENALCIAVNGDNFYCATVLITDNETVQCYGERSLIHDFFLAQNESKTFTIATIYAKGSDTLAEELDSLRYYGATACPYISDHRSTNLIRSDITLNLSAHGYVLKKPQKVLSSTLNYSYQLGDNDVATFLDNAGNSATLIRGFVFGVKGESIYTVKNGLINKINDSDFHLDVDKLRYDKADSSCVIYHDGGKIYEITYKKPCKTLLYLPLEKASEITLSNNKFTVADDERQYYIECENTVESYTTNALECNEEKLRYKLSNNLDAGTCLAICFATDSSVKFKIVSQNVTASSAPIVRESLVSTYLNYINDKNVFCLNNKLKRLDSLTMAAICYTNPSYVKNYLSAHYKTDTAAVYYDATGRRKVYNDRLTFPLACVYYLNLVGDDLPEAVIQRVNGIIFNERFDGKDLCVKALILKKAAQLQRMDKVKCLIEYNLLKKKICGDSNLYAYAQAIGAVPMTNPSKARLKDLCNKYEIPKCWYYVSQLENLYGLSISSGKLYVCPKVTAENALEQFALNINGKRIDTTFTKATVRSMTLNGAQCYQPFFPDKLKNADNQLVVRY